MKVSLAGKDFKRRFAETFPQDISDVNLPRKVSNALYSRVMPTSVSNPRLIAWSESLAQEMGLLTPDPDPKTLAILSGNLVLPNMTPFATRYGGHQFGYWAGQLGDGRALSLGEIEGARSGVFYELQLKGAGPTPYSRSADGRAVLRSSVREYLASEAMYALGIPTTRALSLVLTGDRVLRDMFYDSNPEWEPGAIVCRVSKSFLRFGHFEILRSSNEIELMKKLLNFALEHFYQEIDAKDPRAAGLLFNEVCRRTAVLVAHWMRVGFVHGVLNTDNMSLLGETLDYGPFGFIDEFDGSWTPNTTDFERRRYAFGHQPGVCLWNLERLGEALSPLITDARDVQDGLSAFETVFNQEFYRAYSQKLALFPTKLQENKSFIIKTWSLLEDSRMDLTLFFQSVTALWKMFRSEGGQKVFGSASNLQRSPLEMLLDQSYLPQLDSECERRWKDWLDELNSRWTHILSTGSVQVNANELAEDMEKANPQIILRNYMAQEVIDSLLTGDAGPLLDLEKALAKPYEARSELVKYQKKRPEWARNRPGCATLSCSS